MNLSSQAREPAGGPVGGQLAGKRHDDSSANLEATNGGSGWPPVQYESVVWDVHPGTGVVRQDLANLDRPYQAAVLPEIAAVELRLSGPVLADAEEAAVTVREFDAAMGHELAPFAAVLLRSESASSSQIEKLSASARKIAEAEVTGHGTEHAEMIVGNVRAMEAALALADRLDDSSILAMHEALMCSVEPEIAGRWRDDQVWIGGPTRLGSGSPHDADFVPPTAQRVPEAVSDLVRFAHRTDLPVLPRVAIAHAQFETIHPFPDGNGRTGRALMQAMLRQGGLTSHVSVPISSGLLTNTQVYYDALTAYREGDVEGIVSCVSQAAIIGVANGKQLIQDLNAVRGDWDEKLSGMRSHAQARRLAEQLFAHPVINSAIAERLLGIEKNAHRHIDALVSRGILVGTNDYKSRGMVWRAPQVLAALDEYSARLGRRR